MTATEPSQPLTDEEHPFTSVDNGGPVSGERLAEIREQAEYCSITVEAEELLWLLRQADEVSQLRAENTAVKTQRDQFQKMMNSAVSAGVIIDGERLDALRERDALQGQLDEAALDLGHEFLPVNGHPDDDECTFRNDGTDLTYCGEPKAAHARALGLGELPSCGASARRPR